jgi:hypothetical protein
MAGAAGMNEGLQSHHPLASRAENRPRRKDRSNEHCSLDPGSTHGARAERSVLPWAQGFEQAQPRGPSAQFPHRLCAEHTA